MYVKPYYEQDYEDKEYYELNKPRIKSVDDWKKILINELEFNTGFDFIHNVLVEMYYSLDKTIFCKELKKKIGRGDINLQVGHFRDRIKGYIETSYVEQIGNDTGKDRAWNIPFYSNEKINNIPENIGKFSWVLRDELVQAMEELEIVNAKDTRVMTFPINGTEDIIQKYNIHAHPVKRGYPKQITPFVAFRINGGSIDKVFKLKHVTECSPSNISLIKNQLTPEEYKKLLGYVNDRYDTFGFGESDVDYRFYFLEEYKDLLPRFVMKKNNQNAKVYSLDELISGNEYNQRILFCNVAYMRHYDYINFKETPVNGGQYIDDTGDAFEKNNFHRCEDGKVKGFVETKYVGGYDNKTRTPKQLHIENIDSNYKNLDEIEDVTVVFCAKNPNKNINAIVIVGWYKNAKVYRNRKEYLGRVYNIEANFDEAVLLPEHNRVKIIPRATTNKDNIGFGQANIWYANKSEHKTLVLDVLNYINDCNNEKKKKYSRRINVREDNKLNDSINTKKVFASKSFEYTSEEVFRTEPQIVRQGVAIYKRDRQKAINSLVHADFKCEADPTHETFKKKSDGLPYLEAHHLIPMSEQDHLEHSLDVEENIVSLCSRCHNEIHYGENADVLITKLYYERIELLNNKKIDVTLDELLSFYGFGGEK